MSRLPSSALPFLLGLPALWLVPACSGKTTASDDSAGAATLTVLMNAPTPTATYYANQQVPFEVIARVDGKPTDITHATWSLDDGAQTKDAASGNFDGMSAGSHTVHVDVLAGGLTGSLDETFTVSPPEGDTDTDTDSDTDTDTGTGTGMAYVGTIAANIDYNGQFGSFGSPCPGTISYSVDTTGSFDGTGDCVTTDGGYDFPFTLHGTTPPVAGELVMTYNGNPARTPFSGHGAAGGTMSATYDTTQTYASDTVRIYGTWTADPQ